MIAIAILIIVTILVLFSYGTIKLMSHSTFWDKITNDKLRKVSICSTYILIIILLAMIFNLVSSIVIIAHVDLFVLFYRYIFNVISKKKHIRWKFDIGGVVAIIFAVIYFSFGWYYAHHIKETSYDIESNKIENDYRIALIADVHLGTTLSGKEFNEQLKRIESTNPDMLLIVGDFVDNSAKLEDILVACEGLKNFKSTYGVYYVYGNHDKDYFSNEDLNDISVHLENANVNILEDEVVLINDELYVIGRQDKRFKRKDIDSIVGGLDDSKFMLVLNHQPNDYAKEASSNVDLVVSGHTHGGHLFPFKILGDLFKINDQTYGMTRKDNTDFIVTSGLSGWGFLFKTDAVSEYVIINLKKKSV